MMSVFRIPYIVDFEILEIIIVVIILNEAVLCCCAGTPQSLTIWWLLYHNFDLLFQDDLARPLPTPVVIFISTKYKFYKIMVNTSFLHSSTVLSYF
jgi:hypothetical protein